LVHWGGKNTQKFSKEPGNKKEFLRKIGFSQNRFWFLVFLV